MIAPGISNLLPAAEAESIRDVAMAYLRPIARQEVRKNVAERVTRMFVIYDDSGGEVGSNMYDYFLGFVLTKKQGRQWSMTLSFLENELSEEKRYANYRELYKFDVDSSGLCFARKKTYENFGRILLTRHENDAIYDIVKPELREDISLLDEYDCDELCDRILDFPQKMMYRGLNNE